jgi:hypothetical protein
MYRRSHDLCPSSVLDESTVFTESPESSLKTGGFSTGPPIPSFPSSPAPSPTVLRRFFLSKLVQINACIHPHSMAFLSSQGAPTGFVKKSLHPAAKASFLSDSRDDAVRATMMTGDGKGRSPSSSPGDGESSFSSEKTPMWFTLSNRRISLVASIPDITGSWMSIYRQHNSGVVERVPRLDAILLDAIFLLLLFRLRLLRILIFVCGRRLRGFGR